MEQQHNQALDIPAPVQDSAPGLKSCPFCGKAAEISNPDIRAGWVVGCGNCDAVMDINYKTTAEAIAAWNRRAPAAQPASVPSEVVEAINFLCNTSCYTGGTNSPMQQSAIRHAATVSTWLAKQQQEQGENKNE